MLDGGGMGGARSPVENGGAQIPNLRKGGAKITRKEMSSSPHLGVYKTNVMVQTKSQYSGCGSVFVIILEAKNFLVVNVWM